MPGRSTAAGSKSSAIKVRFCKWPTQAESMENIAKRQNLTPETVRYEKSVDGEILVKLEKFHLQTLKARAKKSSIATA